MLELSRRIGLRVDIGNFLELQGGLQGCRVIHIPADKIHIFGIEIFGCKILNGLLIRKTCRHKLRQALKLFNIRLKLLF